VQASAAQAGSPRDWIDAARRSPVYDLAVRHRVALPLHPEYRTLPMVWYIPPLSPVADVVHGYGDDEIFAAIDALRIPVEYLANLFTAGDPAPVRAVLRKLAAVRAIQRAAQLGLDLDEDLPAAVGSTPDDLDDLYRLLAIAKYEQRYVIPPAHAEEAGRLAGQHEQLFCSLDTDGGPGMGGAGPHGIQAWRPDGAPGQDHTFRADDGRARFNLLGWDGRGDPPDLFPERGTR
jgi:nitrate reductase beta subunit